jgi:3-isopropylmalate/(R)-2-methylmalate dehydratase small subunit
MKASNIVCVLGKSFARIFQRNCINLGLPVVAQPEAAEAAEPGAKVRVDTDGGEVLVDGRSFRTAPVPSFMQDMISSGGLVPWGKARLAKRSG